MNLDAELIYETADATDECRYHAHYSGRHGRDCCGVSGSMAALARFFFELGANAQLDHGHQGVEWPYVQFDNLGLDTIAYFPEIVDPNTDRE